MKCKIFFGISAALAAGFIVKTCVDRYNYLRTVNSAPFSIWIAENALFFLLPAVIFACIPLLIMRKTRILIAGAAVFAAVSAVIVLLNGLPDGFLLAIPAILSAIGCGIFALFSRKIFSKN